MAEKNSKNVVQISTTGGADGNAAERKVKRLTGLDEKALGASGEPYRDGTIEHTILTLLRLIIMNTKKVGSPLEAVMLFDVSEKLRHAKTEVELTESEYGLLKACVEKNDSEWSAHLIGLVYRRFI